MDSEQSINSFILAYVLDIFDVANFFRFLSYYEVP